MPVNAPMHGPAYSFHLLVVCQDVFGEIGWKWTCRMASRNASRYVIGVFAGWQALAIAVAALADQFEVERRLAVLAMTDTFQSPGATAMVKAASPRLREALREKRDLQLGNAAIVCTPGPLADLLERRIRDGCLHLAEALSMWMFPQQAREFAEDIQRGHILLWVRLLASDPEQDISETLLANGPLRIEVHDLMPPANA